MEYPDIVHLSNHALGKLIKTPPSLWPIMQKFREFNFQLYMVGTCVWESLHGMEPVVWEIATDAKLDVAKKLLNSIEHVIVAGPYEYDIGGSFLVVKIEKLESDTEEFEEASYHLRTFRPQKFQFPEKAPDLTSELGYSRYTVEAMAYDPFKCDIIDPYNGLGDMVDRLIKPINDPLEIIRQRPCEILEYLKAALVHGYSLEEYYPSGGYRMSLTESITREMDLLRMIPKKDVLEELRVLLTCDLCSAGVNEFGLLIDALKTLIPELAVTNMFKQYSQWHEYDLLGHLAMTLERCKRNTLHVRLAALLHDIGKPYSIQVDPDGTRHFKGHPEVSKKMANDILTRLGFGMNTIRRTCLLIGEHENRTPLKKEAILEQLNRLGEAELMRDLFSLQRADEIAHGIGLDEFDENAHLEILDEILNDGWGK